ncbi:RNA polymerase sigma factor [Lacihabitans sp. CS3-21]|jgi:RNA polymerase sigma-70 factor (ECF subfamily)|uniref:RNA polymerase sigma factor n=1 Tax=Lacihabitans sp. CS3-21 TaxID=2487332 RepID=UPI000BD916A8|nr:RNA polymerase sigma factor [Lacihabitans sp. CS3-21]MCP9746127.1 RNA polymerase sigma factor [Lacihabitans sp. CS3-21]MDP1814736.1 RNA polymerase sigma factor [Leadbetterella sp.]OYU66035.1 MAG: RNA polymerase subunit sigma [Cytophagaceae bacterium BCCC1]
MTAIEFNYALQTNTKTLKPFAMRLTKNYDDANDLVQDTLVKAFLNKDKYADGTNLKAWLFTIMKNTFITNYQRMMRKNTIIDTSDNLHYINSSDSIVQNDAYGNFANEDISKALEKLDDTYKEPFMMYFNGFKYHEIAEKVAIPIGTVKNRIHLARKELKDRLKIYSNTQTV